MIGVIIVIVVEFFKFWSDNILIINFINKVLVLFR